MPKVSKESAGRVEDNPMVEVRGEELDGYRTEFVSIRQGHDLAPDVRGLPDDRCQCPQWGYAFKGKFTWRFGDHEEASGGGRLLRSSRHAPEAERAPSLCSSAPPIGCAWSRRPS